MPETPRNLPEDSPSGSENIESVEMLRIIGEDFVAFCNETKGEYNRINLEEKFSSKFPGIEVKVVFRPTGAQELYFVDRREESAREYWKIDIKGNKLLVPVPVTPYKFDSIGKAFETKGTITPKDLKQCLPATLKVNDLRWEIEKEGLLSDEAPKYRSTKSSETTLELDRRRLKEINDQIQRLEVERQQLEKKIKSKQ